MKQIPINHPGQLCEGMIVLCGSYFYRVRYVFHNGFTGDVWEKGMDTWAPMPYKVPMPHPAHSIHEVTETHLFEES